MTDNVILFPGTTQDDLEVARMLHAAIEANLDKVIILGWDQDGNEYMTSSTPDGGDVIWLLERCKHRLMVEVEK